MQAKLLTILSLLIFLLPLTTLANPQEPEIVTIKGACFLMGSPETEAERKKDEKQHQVCVKDFKLGKYEITQAQWQAVMGENPAHFKGENLPVERVSYKEVMLFIAKLNQKTGKAYRLPTEAEWEYAARAGTTSPFYTGDCIKTDQANFHGEYDYHQCGAKSGLFRNTTTAVGSFAANPFGLYDMAGNVWEWTCSLYVESYDGSEQKCQATENATELHSIRGGSYNFYAGFTRSALRDRLESINKDKYVGFRIALD